MSSPAPRTLNKPLIGITADDGVLHAHIETVGGASIWIIDPASGRVLGKIRLVSPKAGQK